MSQVLRSPNTVLVIGSNPSCRSKTNDAFHESTKSGAFLTSWFKDLDVGIHFDNVVDYPTPKNRQLKVSEIKEVLPNLKQRLLGYNKIVAVGNTASKALDLAGIPHFKAPHPSGLNRFWNHKERKQQMIEDIRAYVRAK